MQNGNITEFLLREGFARCVDWSMGVVTQGREKLRHAEKYATDYCVYSACNNAACVRVCLCSLYVCARARVCVLAYVYWFFVCVCVCVCVRVCKI